MSVCEHRPFNITSPGNQVLETRMNQLDAGLVIAEHDAAVHDEQPASGFNRQAVHSDFSQPSED